MRFGSITLLFLFNIFIYADCKVTGVAVDDVLNVRQSSNPNSDIIGELASDSSGIKVLKCQRRESGGTWCKIKYRDSIATMIGWVNSRFISCDKPKMITIPRGTKYCVSSVKRGDVLNVRIGPSPSAKKIGELGYMSTELNIIMCADFPNGTRWCKIFYNYKGSTITGWINAKYLTACEDN